MTTLIHLKEVLSHFASQPWKDSKEIIATMTQLVYLFPNLLHPICDVNIDADVARQVVRCLKETAHKNSVPRFPSVVNAVDIIGEQIIETPLFDSYMEYRGQIDKKDLIDYLLNMVLSVPINKLNITFVELGDELVSDFFLKKINPKIFHNTPITNEYSLREYVEKMKKRIIEVKKLYGNYYDYCLNNNAIPIPYEVMVISENSTTWFLSYKEDIDFINRHSKETGIFVIKCNADNKARMKSNLMSLDLNNVQSCAEWICGSGYTFNEITITTSDYHYGIKSINEHLSGQAKVTLNPYSKSLSHYIYRCEDGSNNLDVIKRWLYNSPYFQGEDCEYEGRQIKIVNLAHGCKPLIECTPLTRKSNLLNACIEYINAEADKVDELTIISQDIHRESAIEYELNPCDISVSVGKDHNTEVKFRMDLVSHVHSFVVGQSGSGKSVFLHNIISSCLLKYSPEDLQLYLLDFKLGGVEFNRYKGIKHIKSLLVDNSDYQITLEILRELLEQMIERGKRLRNAGVDKLTEYNDIYPANRLPQILVVVDECHEMFRTHNEIPRAISNEISDIVAKVAKEGRNQGVHLVLATQTLSGTEISNEILHNISDYYILKCAPSDSNRLVDGSSEITGKLQTGQIYYHHIGRQVQFQAYFNNKENTQILIDLARRKAEGHKSNGEFYFNGSQLFKLSEQLFEFLTQKYCASPVAYVGKNISMKQNDVSIVLRRDYSENILLLGLNNTEQVTRTTINLLLSLIMSCKAQGTNTQFKVLNYLPEDSRFFEQLEMISTLGYCEIIKGRKEKGVFLKQLCRQILNETEQNIILFVLGQERFREMKLDLAIDDEQEASGPFGSEGFSFSKTCPQRTTFRQAFEVILNKGPELGVHTVMQLDKPVNFLFSDYITPRMIYEKFKHLILLRSDEQTSLKLGLNDSIRLESLNSDAERLRAYYYSEESDSYTLFTPYMTLNADELVNLLKH